MGLRLDLMAGEGCWGKLISGKTPAYYARSLRPIQLRFGSIPQVTIQLESLESGHATAKAWVHRAGERWATWHRVRSA
jgi:hypothetical protein